MWLQYTKQCQQFCPLILTCEFFKIIFFMLFKRCMYSFIKKCNRPIKTLFLTANKNLIWLKKIIHRDPNADKQDKTSKKAFVNSPILSLTTQPNLGELTPSLNLAFQHINSVRYRTSSLNRKN